MTENKNSPRASIKRRVNEIETSSQTGEPVDKKCKIEAFELTCSMIKQQFKNNGGERFYWGDIYCNESSLARHEKFLKEGIVLIDASLVNGSYNYGYYVEPKFVAGKPAI